jgi:transcription elongation GreA/GreB family factor
LSQVIKAKLQGELDELESELRVHLPKEIKRALEFGDLRENSEYKAASSGQNMVKARIVELRQRISEIASIDPNKVPRDRASYGSTLVLYDAEKDEEVTYRLVTPEESDPAGDLFLLLRRWAKASWGNRKAMRWWSERQQAHAILRSDNFVRYTMTYRQQNNCHELWLKTVFVFTILFFPVSLAAQEAKPGTPLQQQASEELNKAAAAYQRCQLCRGTEASERSSPTRS